MKIDELVSIFQDEGYRAKLETDNDGDSYIISKFSGYSSQIWINFSDADPINIRSLSFRSAFSRPTNLEKINHWNRSKRYVAAYMDDEGDPRLQMDAFVMDGGASLISNILSIWDLAMGSINEL